MIRPFRGVHPQVHETAFVAYSAQIIGDVHIGEQASVCFGTVVRGDMFYIRIGDRTNVAGGGGVKSRAVLEKEMPAAGCSQKTGGGKGLSDRLGRPDRARFQREDNRLGLSGLGWQ